MSDQVRRQTGGAVWPWPVANPTLGVTAEEIKVQRATGPKDPSIQPIPETRATEFLNPTDTVPYRSISDMDRTHHLVVTGIWDMPIGRGKRIGNGMPKPVDLFLGGWQLPFVDPLKQESSFGLQILGALVFQLKSWVMIFLVIWIRWTLLRVLGRARERLVTARARPARPSDPRDNRTPARPLRTPRGRSRCPRDPLPQRCRPAPTRNLNPTPTSSSATPRARAAPP